MLTFKEMIMKKTNINLIIDALLLLSLGAITGIGLLIKFILVAGYQRWEIYGRNVSLFLWGLDRHQWGTIHSIIALVFIVLLALHIILHWSMIVGISRNMIPNRFVRWITTLILVVLTIILVIFPYFIKPEVSEGRHGEGHSRHQCRNICNGMC